MFLAAEFVGAGCDEEGLKDGVADVVLFLVSNQARYICGELLEVNGGKPVK